MIKGLVLGGGLHEPGIEEEVESNHGSNGRGEMEKEGSNFFKLWKQEY